MDHGSNPTFGHLLDGIIESLQVWANLLRGNMLYTLISFNRSVIFVNLFQMNVIRSPVRMAELVLTGNLCSCVNVPKILVGGCVKLFGTGSLQQRKLYNFEKQTKSAFIS